MTPRRRPVTTRTAIVAVVAALTSSCAFVGSDGDDAARGAASAQSPTESGLPDDPEPTRGGQLVYGLEAESSGGWCLPEAQLAMSGLQVVRAIYDPLTVPDADGGYAPYLARSVTSDDSHQAWTITLRPGITFHDGSELDATVVKNNLDAYRGAYDARSPLLFSFVYENIDEVTVVNELTVRVTTKVPWVAFPAALYNSGRVAMLAQSQLDADAEGCATRPIGTGPFEFVSWSAGESLQATRNADYWQVAPDGEPYPYVEAFDFRPMPNNDARMAALQQGELNMMHTSTMADMAENLATLRDEGAIGLLVSEECTETAYTMINTSVEPLDDLDVRTAIAQAIDRNDLNERANKGFATLADGPFAPGVLGHLNDPGGVEFDLDAARDTVAAMEADGRRTEISLLTSVDPAAVRQAGIQKEMLEAVGFTVELEVELQADLISLVITGDFDLAAFRNQPGGRSRRQLQLVVRTVQPGELRPLRRLRDQRRPRRGPQRRRRRGAPGGL